MDQGEINDREWQDPTNWTGGVLRRYASERDTRLWVRKSNPALGWTLNFAHPSSMFWLIGLILVPLLMVLIPVGILWLVHIRYGR
jgi:uncharacterized membrane protein